LGKQLSKSTEPSHLNQRSSNQGSKSVVGTWVDAIYSVTWKKGKKKEEKDYDNNN
jgi:hypothetical protein